MMPSRNHLCSDVGFAGGVLTPVRVATAAPGRHAVVGGRRLETSLASAHV